LLALLGAGYLALEWGSIVRGLAPRPLALLYGYEPWIRQRPPPEVLPAAPVLFDEVLQFLPWQEFTRREFAAGRVPLWNPYQFCGAPHLGASQPAVLSPLTLLALPRSAWFQHASRFTGFLVAGTGTYLWLAALGLGAAACWLGGVSFAFCGFLTLWAGHPHFLSGVWLPWLLFGAELLVRRHARVRGEGLGLADEQGSQPASEPKGRHRVNAVSGDPDRGFLAQTQHPQVSTPSESGGESGARGYPGNPPVGRADPHPPAPSPADAGAGESNKINPITPLPHPREWGWGEGFSGLAGGVPGQPPSAFAGRAWPGFFAAALAMGASLLGGHVETGFHLALVAGVYTLARGPRALPWLLGAGLFGAGLAAVALLPFLEYLLESSALAARQAGFEMPRALPVQALACLLVPEFLGGEPFGPFRLERLNLNEVAGGFVGPVALALAASARRSPLLRPALAVLGVSLLLAFEPGPVGALAARAPLLGLAYNGRLLLAVALMVSALAAAGLETLRSRGASPLPGFAAVAAGIGLLGLFGRDHLTAASVLLPLACLAAALLLRLPAGRWPALALVAAAALPSLRLAGGYHGGGPAGGAWPDLRLPAGAANPSDRFAALGRQAFPAQIPTAYGLRDLRGYDAMTPRRIEELLARVEPLVEQAGRLGIFRARALSHWAGPLYEFLGVRLLYVGRGVQRPPAGAGFRPLGGGFWSRGPGPGRALFATTVLVLPDEEAVLRHVASAGFDPAVPAFAAPGPTLAQGTPEPGARQAVALRFLADTPVEVAIELDAPVPGVLVLADTDLRGWRVLLDGRPTQALRANFAFRAVQVPKGAHQVRWIYRPESFLAGGFVSSIFLGLVVTWLSFRGVRKRNRRRPPC
jgi:hypothetical protein